MFTTRSLATIPICGLVLSMLVAGAPAARAQHGSLDAMVSAVEQLYGQGGGSGPMAPGSTGGVPARHPCALVRDLERRWDSLPPATRARLAPFLLPPDARDPDRPADAPGAAGSTYWKLDTEHFELRYDTEGTHAVVPADGDGNNVPDYIEDAARYLEEAYSKQIAEFGFGPPPGPRPRVWFRKLLHNGLTHYRPGQQIWIELNSDILGYTRGLFGGARVPDSLTRDPSDHQAGLLKAVCAHEFFHAVQAGYNWSTPTWWAEGTADWMGHAVFPESGFYLNNIGPHLEKPHVSLFAKGNFFDYGASIFAVFLSESAGGPTVVREVWEQCRTQDVHGALATVMGDLEETYLLFSAYNYLKAYQDGPRLPDVPRQVVAAYPGEARAPEHARPEYFGAAFVECTPADSGDLVVRLESGGSDRVSARLVLVEADGSWKIHRMTRAGDGSQARVPSFSSQYRKAVVVVGNFAAETLADFRVSATVE